MAMMAQREFENSEHRGPSTIDFDRGRRGGYSCDIFSGRSYIDKKDQLAEWTKGLIIGSGLFTPSVAKDMVIMGMDSGNDQNKSMIFFRRTIDPQGKYVGVSWQEAIEVPTLWGEITVIYFRLRAIEKDHREKHLGRAAVQQAVAQTPEATYAAHRTESAAAAWSFIASKVFRPGRRFPWDAYYTTDPKMQQIMTWLHYSVRVNGTEINMATGVSKGDYPEPNLAFKLDPNHTPTMKLHERMVNEFGMKPKDSLLVVGQLA